MNTYADSWTDDDKSFFQVKVEPLSVDQNSILSTQNNTYPTYIDDMENFSNEYFGLLLAETNTSDALASSNLANLSLVSQIPTLNVSQSQLSIPFYSNNSDTTSPLTASSSSLSVVSLDVNSVPLNTAPSPKIKLEASLLTLAPSSPFNHLGNTTTVTLINTNDQFAIDNTNNDNADNINENDNAETTEQINAGVKSHPSSPAVTTLKRKRSEVSLDTSHSTSETSISTTSPSLSSSTINTNLSTSSSSSSKNIKKNKKPKSKLKSNKRRRTDSKSMNSEDAESVATLLTELPGMEQIRWDSVLSSSRVPDAAAPELQLRVKEAEILGSRLFGGDIDKLLSSLLGQHLDFLVDFVSTRLDTPSPQFRQIRDELIDTLLVLREHDTNEIDNSCDEEEEDEDEEDD